MLTPVDLQQKKFQHGMGYTKKDVDSFFDIVVMSYTELYKSNAELTNQVKTLTDSLVHYRTTESTKNANDKAKIIENDAKIKANNIVHQAREELDRIEDSIEGIKQQYRDYTMAFKNLMDSHLQFLATNPINEELGVDFDEIMKDAKYFNGNAAVYAPGSSGNENAGSGSFASFGGDPQGREESTLGGGGGSGMGDSTLGSADNNSNVASDSSVYTKNLGGGSFVDPFKFRNE